MIQSLSRLRSCSFKPVLLVITVWNVRLRLFPSRPQLIVPCHCDQSLPGMFRCWYKWRPPARNLFVAFNSWENRLDSPFYAQALARAVVLRAWFVAMLLRKRLRCGFRSSGPGVGRIQPSAVGMAPAMPPSCSRQKQQNLPKASMLLETLIPWALS